MDFWTILLAVWLPIAGIVIALCLYAMTEREATPAAAKKTREDSTRTGGTETPSAD